MGGGRGSVLVEEGYLTTEFDWPTAYEDLLLCFFPKKYT